MKLTCKRETFFQLFSLASAVASLRDVKAILQNVKMIVEEGKLILMATDMDLAIRLEMVEVEVSETGEAILPTRLIRNILQASDDVTLTFETKSGKMIVSGEHSFYQLPTQLSDDFPNIAPFNEESYHEVPGKVFRELIRRTKFAIDLENTRYMLGGVLFELTEGRIAAVATDGRRLANQEGAATSHGGHFSENTAIIPLKALALAEKAITVDEDLVKIAVSGGKVIFSSGSCVLSSRLIEGRFPRWKNIIPETEGRVQIDIMAGTLLSAVQQAEVVTSDKQPGIFFDFLPGRLELSGNGPEIGESKVDLPIAYDGAAFRLKMTPQYITDFLRGLERERVVSLFLSGDKSVLFRTDDGYNYVVMPLT